MKKHLYATFSILFFVLLLLCPQKVSAASGKLYSCTITPSYTHPVTGKIEDSGGSSATATGQGMVESAVTTSGLLEVTDDGNYYLNFRMSLIDYTSKHSFSVQKVNESGWTKRSATKTATGSDDNGKTADYCIQVPSENSIVRCSMYVDAMGREVVFYFYPTDYKEGNSTNMKATKVTTSSQGQNSTQTTQTQETTNAATQATTATINELDDAQGLSLSTKEEAQTSTTAQDDSLVKQTIALTLSLTISGLILLFVAALLVYYFRKNWNRFGGDPEEYEDLYDET